MIILTFLKLFDTTFFFFFLASELVLRKVINFSDCTVCLDKRNASGKIEFYQDPLLYKCSFRTRLHFTYENMSSKIPSVIKVTSNFSYNNDQGRHFNFLHLCCFVLFHIEVVPLSAVWRILFFFAFLFIWICFVFEDICCMISLKVQIKKCWQNWQIVNVFVKTNTLEFFIV